MSFINEIKDMLGIEGEGFFKATLIGDSSLYIEGVKYISDYSNEEIVIKVKNAQITIKGKELVIKKYCLGDLVICGKITSLARN